MVRWRRFKHAGLKDQSLAGARLLAGDGPACSCLEAGP
jgi:hypothetical protein